MKSWADMAENRPRLFILERQSPSWTSVPSYTTSASRSFQTYHKQDSAPVFTLVINFPLNYLLPVPPAARQVSSRPALWLGPLKFSSLCSVCVPVTTCYTLDKNHQEKHWPTNEHPASLRIRPKLPLPCLSYFLPNTGGSCWGQVSCCQPDRLTQDCSKSPAQKTSPVKRRVESLPHLLS